MTSGRNVTDGKWVIGFGGTVHFALAENTWYKFIVNLQKTSATEVTVDASLQNWGSDGIAYVSTVRDLPALAITNAALVGDTTTFASFTSECSIRLGYDHGAADNFPRTPEPATMALLGLGALTVLARRRRA